MVPSLVVLSGFSERERDSQSLSNTTNFVSWVANFFSIFTSIVHFLGGWRNASSTAWFRLLKENITNGMKPYEHWTTLRLYEYEKLFWIYDPSSVRYHTGALSCCFYSILLCFLHWVRTNSSFWRRNAEWNICDWHVQSSGEQIINGKLSVETIPNLRKIGTSSHCVTNKLADCVPYDVIDGSSSLSASRKLACTLLSFCPPKPFGIQFSGCLPVSPRGFLLSALASVNQH